MEKRFIFYDSNNEVSGFFELWGESLAEPSDLSNAVEVDELTFEQVRENQSNFRHKKGLFISKSVTVKNPSVPTPKGSGINPTGN